MIQITKVEIEAENRIKRLNIINSISGVKPGNLIGTKSGDGLLNLAVFSSVIHLGSSPALLGFVLRPTGEVPRHTYENILETGYYTINHIHHSFVENAHFTSAKFDKGISEFEQCRLTPEYIGSFAAPFVRESRIKIGLRYVESVPISINGTTLVIGEIETLTVPEQSMNADGCVDLSTAGSAGIGGLNSY
ncbi:MAG: flavin reductase [Putridiphycobacter sp.]|nr:flavin reductase [Putridiphycobacter sp.]